MARAEHGPRRLPARISATRPGTSTTGPSAASRRCSPARRGRRGALAVPVDDAARACLSVAERPSRPPRAPDARVGLRARRADPLGRDRHDRARHLRVLLRRLARPRRRRLRGDLAAVVGAVRHRLGDLPADRAAALAHDRRPPGARDRARPPAAHAAADPGRLRARVPGRRAAAARADPGRPVRRLGRAVLDPRRRRARLRGELLRARLAGRAPVVRLYGGLVFLEATSRLLFALAVAVGIAEGQTAVALGMAAAPFVSLVVVPLAFSRRPRAGRARARGDELGLARGGRFAVAVLRSCSPSRRCSTRPCSRRDLTAEDAAVAGFVFNVLLIARAPLQLFQAVQGSLAPPPRRAGGDAPAARRRPRRARHRARDRRLRARRRARAAAIGPWAMDLLFDDGATYGRWGSRWSRSAWAST